jgi:hypothetical protein
MTSFVSLILSLTFYLVVAFLARWSIHGMLMREVGPIWYWFFGVILFAAFINTMKGPKD